MDATNSEWTARQTGTDQDRREYERERLIAWTLDAISELISSCDMSKADVARKLETSRANITQVLSGSRNATLATISDLAWACGKRAVFRFEPLRNGEFISSPVMQTAQITKIVPMSRMTVARQGDGDVIEFINERATFR